MAGRWEKICCLVHNKIEYEYGDRGCDGSYYLTGVSTGHIYSDTLSLRACCAKKSSCWETRGLLFWKRVLKGIKWIYCPGHAAVRGDEWPDASAGKVVVEGRMMVRDKVDLIREVTVTLQNKEKKRTWQCTYTDNDRQELPGANGGIDAKL